MFNIWVFTVLVYTIHQSFVKEKHRQARWVWPTVVLKVDSKAPYYGTFLQKFFRKTTAFCTVFSLALAFCSQPSQSSSSSPENNSKTFKQSTWSCIHPVLTMQVFIIIQKYCYSIIESITFLTYSFYSFDIPYDTLICATQSLFFSPDICSRQSFKNISKLPSLPSLTSLKSQALL